MKTKRKKETLNQGITLIALVITIIVLLILAAVSISTLTGDNGILTKANEAKKQTEIAEVKERVQTEILEAQATNESGKITRNQLETILGKYFTDVSKLEVLSDEEIAEVFLTAIDEYGGHSIKVSDIWSGTTLGTQEEKNLAKDVLKVDATATEAKDTSPYVKYNGLDCRVLYNDETHGLQIITVGNVKNVTLGSGDSMVTASDFSYDGTATINNEFKKAAASYNNVVDNLNKIAKTYMDTKGIATDARCLGSISTLNSSSKFQGDISEMWSGSYAYLTTYKWNDKFKNTDTNYYEDEKQLNKLKLNISSGYSCLASRLVESSSSYLDFYVRYIDFRGDRDTIRVLEVFSNGTTAQYSNSNFGFRPIFLLSPNVVINSGNGSSENPYVIE